MAYKRFILFQISVLMTIWSITIDARLTTLKHFDPSPIYSANNSMMPPNSQFLDLRQARIKGEQPSKKRVLGFNVSGFVQRAVRARGYNGNYEYGSVTGLPPSAFELGDFRGTLNTLGLFLGANPNNGNTIWANGEDNGNPANITATSIANFKLPSCLEEIALNLTGHGSGSTPPAALVFIPANSNDTTAKTGISMFSEERLGYDTTYFGAFSLPIEFQQAGFRWEINVNCSDHIGVTIQSGITNMKQYYVNSINTPASQPGQTAYGPYSLSGLATTGTTPAPVSNLYGQLNFTGTAPSTSPSSTAQALFDKYISNNIATILSPHCLDNDPICSFDEYNMDDVKVILSFKGVYDPFRARHKDDDDEGTWPDMIFTPYAWVGGSFPIAETQNYSNILSLPFGNNGHVSVGGAVGMTFDFAESVEVGVEGGTTYFLSKQETRPFPTHRLQRILFPFEATVVSQPGLNWHFRALLNAYQFIKHVNFWMTYELIEHRRDDYKICNNKIAQYFVPEVLTCRSDWRAQFFNVGLSFDFQPGWQASIAWQQPISPRNAYYPVSIMGSINFMF